VRPSLAKTWRSGEPLIWLTGGALAFVLLLVAGLIGLILSNGLGFFWPKDVIRLTLADGKIMTGQVADREAIPGQPGQSRIKLKVANRDLYGADFTWVDEAEIARREYPPDVAVIERTEWGLLIGTVKEIRDGDAVVATGSEAGWVEVDKHPLQHVRFPNVFSLGDASSLPTSKTGAAIRGQAPVLVQNLIAAIQGKPLPARYDGYTACPLVTGYGKLILAEFIYDGIPKETFPFDQSKERWSMYQLKKRGLPLLYWRGMMKGRA